MSEYVKTFNEYPNVQSDVAFIWLFFPLLSGS